MTISPTTPASSVTLWTSADLLARCKMYARRPVVDEAFGDDQWYMLLTEANAEFAAQIAAVAPDALFAVTGPTLMTTADGGLSYTFGTDPDGNQVVPTGRCEIRQTPSGKVWVSGAEWDTSADFVDEGWRIRFPNQVVRTFGNGPWARFVTPTGTINATTQPNYDPASMARVLVYKAVGQWARIGGTRDPGPYEEMEQKALWGDPLRGQHGILPMLQSRFLTQGAEAIGGVNRAWWRGGDLGTSGGQGYSTYGVP